MKIPIFNRVSQIESSYRDIRDLPLSKEDVTGLHELERISVTKSIGGLTSSDVQAVKDLVPPCRLAAASNTTAQIKINVIPGNALACSSQ